VTGVKLRGVPLIGCCRLVSRPLSLFIPLPTFPCLRPPPSRRDVPFSVVVVVAAAIGRAHRGACHPSRRRSFRCLVSAHTMASVRQGPPRLHIPPHLANQAPAAMFSPGLPTAIQGGFPQFNPALATPVQTQFFPGVPPPFAPGRPGMHRTRSSVAHFALPTPGLPITPLGQGFPGMGPPPLFAQQQQQQQLGSGPTFVPKSRRTMSVGGPPKAPLGGPGRKHELAPAPVVAPPVVQPPPKTKKSVVNLPKETLPAEDGQPATRAPWARTPLTITPENVIIVAPELITAEEMYEEPDPVELFVYLPSKVRVSFHNVSAPARSYDANRAFGIVSRIGK
jgi:hypothetical protein